MPPDHVDKNVRLGGYYVEQPLFLTVHNAVLGNDVILRPYCNLYGCTIMDGTKVGAYTEIGSGVLVGRNCKIGAYVFIPPGVVVEDDVFIGPRVTFTNDKYPKATGDWVCLHTRVGKGASIGAGCVILPGLTIGEGAMVGAGSVVTKDVAPHTTYFNRIVANE